MREPDNKLLEVAKSGAQRFHRGAMGRVLQRYLQLHGARQAYSLGQLELLWQQAAQRPGWRTAARASCST